MAENTRILLLTTPHTYRAAAFISAAEKLGLDATQVIDLPPALAESWSVTLGVPFAEPERATELIVEYAREHPVRAIVPVDDSATLLAAQAANRLSLPYNSPDSALAARDKWVMREMLAAGGLPVPRYQRFLLNEDPREVAAQAAYPCVLKPLRLSGSRGVIRADDPDDFVAAFDRIRRLLASDGHPAETTHILVEEFIPGFEVALEGLLTGGKLRVLALFDKPDPLDGPFFEETIYVTPSRLDAAVQRTIADCTERSARALGLREGPVHAELRVNERGPWLVEMAGRSIGGLCSSILQFGTGMTLEELILRHAVGLPLDGADREALAAGVMMIPIPRTGMLMGVDGLEEARAVRGIVDVEITARFRQPILPLPEGASYLGFIFARAETPAQVEAALREAHGRLRFDIQPLIQLSPT